MRGGQPRVVRNHGHATIWSGALAVCLLALIGCGGERYYTQIKSTESVSVPAAASPAEPGGEVMAAQETGRIGDPVPASQPRKIIYNAQVDLVVESMTTTAEALLRLVKANGGYLSETDSQSYSQQQRQATWKVRIPVDRFDTFLAEVSRLGELQKNHLDSQDVTQEYYDLDARIANKQKEETRLLKHLADSTGKLEDILAVERELSRVRGEIEQMQGRLRYLANMTALSTVTITAIELKDYTPPVSPTFSTQITRTFSFSVDRLVDFGKGTLLVLVASIPWIPVATLLALPLWWLFRRRRVLWPQRNPRPGTP